MTEHEVLLVIITSGVAGFIGFSFGYGLARNMLYDIARITYSKEVADKIFGYPIHDSDI